MKIQSRKRDDSSTRKTRKKSDEARTQARRKAPDLPPNENIQKHPDEIYGDTQIPERKRS